MAGYVVDLDLLVDMVSILASMVTHRSPANKMLGPSWRTMTPRIPPHCFLSLRAGLFLLVPEFVSGAQQMEEGPTQPHVALIVRYE